MKLLNLNFLKLKRHFYFFKTKNKMTVPPSPHTIHFKQTHKEIFINTKCSMVIVLEEGLNGGLPDLV